MKIKGLSETDLIQTLRHEFRSEYKNIVLGIGDDAAVIKPGGKFQVLTKDLLIENTHFVASQHPPELLARKSLSVNLSDVAAMGCRPRYALYGLGMPPGTDPVWLEAFISSLKQALGEFEVALIGGDVTRAERISISVTLLGEGDTYLTRSGAHAGDRLYVSGTLGDAAWGLELLKNNVKLGENPQTDACLRAFLDPVPQVALGQALSQAEIPSAMIDVSDGLSIDLRHICAESGVGAEVDIDSLPLSEALTSLASEPLNWALYGGEDYQLLFSVSEDKRPLVPGLQASFPVTEIGRITPGNEVFSVDVVGEKQILKPAGFQHF